MKMHPEYNNSITRYYHCAVVSLGHTIIIPFITGILHCNKYIHTYTLTYVHALIQVDIILMSNCNITIFVY